MYDNFNRQINYLRISVTDRCNLRCQYCMPAEGVQLLSHNEILSFEEITGVARVAVGMGVVKIRITGGEPLVRKGIVNLVQMLSALPGVNDLSITTNGTLLAGFASALKAAGLNRVNVSLDTLDAEKFLRITRGGKLEDALAGIAAAQAAGLNPVKINCVVQQNAQEPDALMVADYCRRNNLQVRFIHQMDLSGGHFSIVEGGSGGDCSTCNRLRLTADGRLMPCLFNEAAYNVRVLGAETAIRLALSNKPACGSINTSGQFYNIGG